MTRHPRPGGMFVFTIVWIGQTVSMFGSAMTWFAFTIWAWQSTGQASALATVVFFSEGLAVLFSPVAGALVDRWNRKRVMMLSDLAAGLSTIAVLLLYTTGNLKIWHLYVAAAFAGIFQAFQFPAYSAAVTMMLPKEHYARAESMVWMAKSAATVFAPPLAAVLLEVTDIAGIMVFDVITFLAAIGVLLWVTIPQPVATEAGRRGKGSLWQESVYGFRYILERPSLLSLQFVFFGCNLFDTLAFVVIPPMILARSGDNTVMLGSVLSAGALGGIVGAALLSLWGGPKRRIHGVLIGWVLANLLGTLLMGLGHTLSIFVLASFFSAFFTPLINGSDQAIWQTKVAPDVQGRVFGARMMLTQISVPIAMLLGGPLADFVFEPAMMSGGLLATTFGGLVGTGVGSGMALMLILVGILGALVGLGGYAFRAVRNIEDLLPDYDGGVALSAEVRA